MADRFDKSQARRPADVAPRRSDMADLQDDDPLVELARIVSGNESFDEILGSRYRQPEAPRAAPSARGAAPRDTSFDLEAELLNDLQSSFDPAPRPAPAARAPEPRIAEPRMSEPRMYEPRMSEPRMSEPRAPEPRAPQPPRPAAPRTQPAADTFDHMAMRPGAPLAPPRAAASQQPSPDAYVAAPDFGRGRVPDAVQRRPVAPPTSPPVAVRDDDDYDDYVDDDDLRADYEDDEGPYADEPEYETETPRRSRKALITIGVVLAVVVVGGVAAMALKGRSSVSGGTPQVIAADEAPTKIAPEVKPVTDPNAQQNKLIYDRADPDKGSPDQLQIPDDGTADATAQSNESQASREISRIILPGGPGDESTTPAVPGGTDPATADEGDDAGPRKVRTVVVKPDGTIVSSEAAPRGAAAANDAPAAAPTASAPAVVAAAPEAAAPAAEAPANDAPAADAQSDGTMSLDALTPSAKDSSQLAAPDTAPAPVAAAPAPVAAAPAAVKPAAPSSGGFVVQVSSQRSEAAALAAYKNLQRKFPSVMGDRAPDVAKADLGAKGVYYRARVGPMATRDEAVSFCEQLRAAGGDCIVQKN